MNAIKKNMEAYKLNESSQRGFSTTNREDYAMEDDTSEDDSVITTSSRSTVSRKLARTNLRKKQVSDTLSTFYQCL